jgi:hypothetical protein
MKPVGKMLPRAINGISAFVGIALLGADAVKIASLYPTTVGGCT